LPCGVVFSPGRGPTRPGRARRRAARDRRAGAATPAGQCHEERAGDDRRHPARASIVGVRPRRAAVSAMWDAHRGVPVGRGARGGGRCAGPPRVPVPVLPAASCHPRSRARPDPVLRRRGVAHRSTVLITGASAGLGEGMARRWAAQGKNLALCARRLDRLEVLRAELEASNPSIRVAVRALDVTDGDAVQETFGDLDAELGGIDRFALNTGLGKRASTGSGKAHANRETAMVNVIGTLNQAESAMEILTTRGEGHLVFISSVSSLRGMPKAQNTYGASKAFVSSLAQGMHAELDS